MANRYFVWKNIPVNTQDIEWPKCLAQNSINL